MRKLPLTKLKGQINECYIFTKLCLFLLRCSTSVYLKYERILLLASRILVGRICILKYDVFWLGVFGVF